MTTAARSPVTLALATLIAGAAHAQSTPAAYVERSQVLPTGNLIHAYRVPTTDTEGKLRYFDVTVELFVNDKGKFASSANVVAVTSPKVLGNKFIPGTYTSPTGVVCTVNASILSSSRQQGAVSCASGDKPFSASWVTGLIEGHPFELDLRAAGIDKIEGYADYAWGKIGSTPSTVWFGCMSTGEVVSAVQSGDQLTLGGYDLSNIQKCSVTLTLKP